ncbi:hypothetical protein [Pseudomonas sp. M30-35]|uniref:hypothetical protein n=1 Tax=Pseudomonas sp. M30-35 TaxID=1981174 RepID=UPI000B3C5ABA|nr:hypothetical protein [Pseudomonas sp. M30-35]ARU86484.1 hypothetical protein B9K09_00060 [Pseudomonas sp. M30-35]
MNKRIPTTWLGVLAISTLLPAHGASVRGSVGVDTTLYSDEPLYQNQSSRDVLGSGYADLSLAAESESGDRYDLSLFSRISPDRQHKVTGDIRQASVWISTDLADYKFGVLKQTWGMLEAWSPVDIINQRDMAEDFQGKVKLGQPGAVAAFKLDDSVLSLYGTTYARERRFGEGRDRLRILPAPITDEHYERGRWAPDFAARYQFRLGDSIDIAVSQFKGHNREPVLQALADRNGVYAFTADYQTIEQTGLEAQYVYGDSIFKSEVIYQDGAEDSFFGGGVGAETNFATWLGGMGDLTLYAEFYHDDRSDQAPITPFQRDIFTGARYSLNDLNGYMLELRNTHDLEWQSNLIDLRASRRMFNDGVLSISLIKAANAKKDPALQGFRNDSYFKIGYAWYY